jgi:hypothetical protein
MFEAWDRVPATRLTPHEVVMLITHLLTDEGLAFNLRAKEAMILYL